MNVQSLSKHFFNIFQWSSTGLPRRKARLYLKSVNSMSQKALLQNYYKKTTGKPTKPSSEIWMSSPICLRFRSSHLEWVLPQGLKLWLKNSKLFWRHFLLFTFKATLQLVFEDGHSSVQASLRGGEKEVQFSTKEDSSVLTLCTMDTAYQKPICRLSEMQAELSSLVWVGIFELDQNWMLYRMT